MSDCARVEELVVDFLEGELAAEERAELEAHVAACPRCRNTIRSYRTIQDAYREVPDADVAPDVAERILAAARAKRPAAARRRRMLLVAAAVLLALLVPAAVFLSRERESTDIPALVQQGDAQLRAGDLVQAEATYEQALAAAGQGPEEAEVLHKLAFVDVQSGRSDRALERLGALERHPEYEHRREALMLRGEALERLGQLDQAIETYRLVAAEFPQSSASAVQRMRELASTPESMDALQALGYMGGD